MERRGPGGANDLDAFDPLSEVGLLLPGHPRLRVWTCRESSVLLSTASSRRSSVSLSSPSIFFCPESEVPANAPRLGSRLTRSVPPTMDRVKTTKGASYTAAAALMLAAVPLILALPATAAPCDHVGGIVPALICPTPSNSPDPTATPAPTSSATRRSAGPVDPVPRRPCPTGPGSPCPDGHPIPNDKPVAPVLRCRPKFHRPQPPPLTAPRPRHLGRRSRGLRPRPVPWPQRRLRPGTWLPAALPARSCWHLEDCWLLHGCSWTSGSPASRQDAAGTRRPAPLSYPEGNLAEFGEPQHCRG